MQTLHSIHAVNLNNETVGLVDNIEEAEQAINQIKEKEYVQKFVNENSNILAVAICYDSKKKEHHCKIEKLK